jgi:hypothetical protein
LLGRSTKNAVWKRELDLGIVELDGGNTLAVLGGNSGSADDLNGLVARSVATSHVVV